MKTDNIEIFNCNKLENIPGLDGEAFVRVPKEIRNKLNTNARERGMDSIGCEVRFVTEAPFVDVYVICNKAINPALPQHGEIRVFFGNFHCSTHTIIPGITTNIRIQRPASFNVTSKGTLDNGGFSSNVIRIVFNRGSSFVVKDIITYGYDMRPPKPEEKPSINWLAYGSSITNSHLDGYPHVASRMLKVQVQNKGLGGACHLEKEMVDFLVEDCTWDFATCELGINVRGMAIDEFERRATYLINRFAETGKPVMIIGIFPNCHSRAHTAQPNQATEHEEAFEKILERLVNEKKLPQLHFVNGSEILDDFTGLSGDLLHPNPYGYAIMGANVAKLIRSKKLLN